MNETIILALKLHIKNKVEMSVKNQKTILKYINKQDKEIKRLTDIINGLEFEANRNIYVCNNRGFNLISSIDEVKTLDDFTLNEYIGYLVSLEILDKLNELKGSEKK